MSKELDHRFKKSSSICLDGIVFSQYYSYNAMEYVYCFLKVDPQVYPAVWSQVYSDYDECLIDAKQWEKDHEVSKR